MAATLQAKWKQQPVASCDQTVCYDQSRFYDSDGQQQKLFWHEPKLRFFGHRHIPKHILKIQCLGSYVAVFV